MNPVRRTAMSVTLVLCLSVSVGMAADAAEQSQSNCDRECLRGFITQYLSALTQRDPSKLSLANTVRFTEDSIDRKLGQGLWQSAARLRSYRQDFLDVRAGIAGSHVVLEEGSAPNFTPVMLVLRLKITDRKIAEIETMTVRSEKEGAIFDVDAIKTVSAAMAFVPPRSQRPTRAEAIRIADFYPAGLKAGSFVTVDAPFAPKAYRFENGRLMAGPNCTTRPECKNIKTQPSPVRPSLTSRLVAVDEEMGIVWYRLAWDRPSGRTADGVEVKLVVWEAFKVYDGQMQAVEAFMKLVPSSLGSGWE